MRLLAAVTAFSLISACSRTPEPAVQRIAFLPFENLTGDDSLNWIASAAPLIAATDLAGLSGIVPLRTPTLSDGYIAQATRFVHCHFTRVANSAGAQSLRFEIEIEDAARHKVVETDSEEGGVLDAMNRAAKRIDSSARAFSSANAEAVAAWGSGEADRAAALDPDFGAAWLSWAEKLERSGDHAKAIEVATQALARPSLRTPLDRAHIELFLANVRHDAGAKVNALTGLARLTPADEAVLDTLAQAEMNARRFSDAAGRFREILKMNPSNASAMNSLGYAEGLSGNLEAARMAFENYGAQPGQKPNSLDSLGEVYFMAGKFADAEKTFLAANQSNPGFLQGEDLWKAACARWLAGDHQGADALMARYLDFRRKQNDAVADWREASWLFSTGRHEQAMAKLSGVANRQLAERQMLVWRGSIKLPDDLAGLKQRCESTPPSADAQPRVLYAAALIAAGKKDDARPLLEFWPMPWSPGEPVLESWVLPEFLDLRARVGLTAQ